MTDVLGAASQPAPDAARPDGGHRPEDTIGGGRLSLAALLAGTGLIHLAMAPSHLDASAVDGVAFFLAGWAQIGLAALLVVRPTRALLGASIATNLALLAAWAVSRTAGLPVGAHAGESEAVTVVDGACVVLEVLAVAIAVTLLVRPMAWVARSVGMAVIGMVGAVALTTAALASPDARDHASGDHASGGHASDGHAAGHSPGVEDDLGFAALQNGQMGDHAHGPDEGTSAADDVQTLDPATAGTLAGQLALTAPLVERYPTVAEARAAGYRQAGPFSPGLGIHYSKFGEDSSNSDGDMDPADIAAPILIYDGVGDDARLAGFMYMAYQETEPEGFAGSLDRWHYHTAVCIVSTPTGIETPFGADLTGVTEEMCEDEGGQLLDFTGYMVHVWTVPGYESELGTFSDLNPRITCPDGTYHAIPIAEIGGADSTCTNA